MARYGHNLLSKSSACISQYLQKSETTTQAKDAWLCQKKICYGLTHQPVSATSPKNKGLAWPALNGLSLGIWNQVLSIAVSFKDKGIWTPASSPISEFCQSFRYWTTTWSPSKVLSYQLSEVQWIVLWEISTTTLRKRSTYNNLNKNKNTWCTTKLYQSMTINYR